MKGTINIWFQRILLCDKLNLYITRCLLGLTKHFVCDAMIDASLAKYFTSEALTVTSFAKHFVGVAKHFVDDAMAVVSFAKHFAVDAMTVTNRAKNLTDDALTVTSGVKHFDNGRSEFDRRASDVIHERSPTCSASAKLFCDTIILIIKSRYFVLISGCLKIGNGNNLNRFCSRLNGQFALCRYVRPHCAEPAAAW